MHTSEEIDMIAAAVEQRLQPRLDAMDRRLDAMEPEHPVAGAVGRDRRQGAG